ncbi:cyclin J [Lycorma delicatula]|uniref:cyclin J n=1 Tax=Lycorma delicatula TaxID=130591 RepID=UPI003F510056
MEISEWILGKVLQMPFTGSCAELKTILEHAPYAIEIDSYLKKKESECMPFLCRAPQLQYRLQLVNNMRSICRQLELSTITVHLAVHLLDYFMDNYRIIAGRLNLVALVCISLSAKFEEQDGSFPKISQLSNFVENRYPKKDYVTLELMILQFFDWNLARPTVAHFVESYRWLSVFNQDSLNTVSVRNLRKRALSTICDLLDVSLNDYNVNMFKPSLVAASCVYLTRKLLKLTPKWPTILEAVTSYSEDSLEECSVLLLRLYSKQFGNEVHDANNEVSYNNNNNSIDNEDITDHGYHSLSSSNTNSPNETI